MKILAIVVTYYPEKNLLKKNINAFIEYVDKVLIWENTPESEKLSSRFIHDEKIEYCGDGINSISHALNYGWKYAKRNGYDYLLTMDQDSILVNFTLVKEYVKQHYREKALLSPHINMPNIKPVISIVNNIRVTRVDGLITSGSLFYIGLLDILNGFNETLSIDGIDTDLYLRADQLGIPSYRINNYNLVQRFGEPQIRYLFGKRYELTTYSAHRLESILQSHIYIMRKYRNMSAQTKKYIVRHYVVGRIRDVIFFESDKMSKIISLCRGIIKGLFVKL